MTDNLHGVKKESTTIRKKHKIVMEKRRRNRINECLVQLKTLLLQSLKKENSEYSKLEKADILEMTVKYLRNVQRQQFAASVTSDPNAVNKYVAGFNECASEAMRYLGQVSDGGVQLKSHLGDHLKRCAHSSISQVAHAQSPTMLIQNAQMPILVSQQPLLVQIPVIQNTTLQNTQIIQTDVTRLNALTVPCNSSVPSRDSTTNNQSHYAQNFTKLSQSSVHAHHLDSSQLQQHDISHGSLRLYSPAVSVGSNTSRTNESCASPSNSELSFSSDVPTSPDHKPSFTFPKYEFPARVVAVDKYDTDNMGEDVWRPW